MTQQITRESADAAGLSLWDLDESGLSVVYDCGSFTAAGEFAAAVAALADGRDHHPDLAIIFPGHLVVSTLSQDVGHLTQRDVGLAQAVDDLARARGHEHMTDDDTSGDLETDELETDD